jgi:hypothetical protein
MEMNEPIRRERRRENRQKIIFSISAMYDDWFIKS